MATVHVVDTIVARDALTGLADNDLVLTKETGETSRWDVAASRFLNAIDRPREEINVLAKGAVLGTALIPPTQDSGRAFKAAFIESLVFNDEGKATSAANPSDTRLDEATISDSSQSWPANQWRNLYTSGAIDSISQNNTRLNDVNALLANTKSMMVRITNGLGAGQVRSIVAAGTNYCDIEPLRPFDPVPSLGDQYEVINVASGVQAYEVGIIEGPGLGQWRLIVGNTATQLILDRKWSVLPTSASRYRILTSGLSLPRYQHKAVFIPSGTYLVDFDPDEGPVDWRGVYGSVLRGAGQNNTVIHCKGGLRETTFTGVTANTLTKTGEAWATPLKKWRNRYFKLYVWGPERQKKVRGLTIVDNTDDTITLDQTNWPVLDAGTPSYTATGGSTSTVVDSDNNWPYKGDGAYGSKIDVARFYAVRFTGGTAANIDQVRYIDRNDDTTLYFSGAALPAPVASGDTYVIEARPDPSKDTFAIAVEHAFYFGGVAESEIAGFKLQPRFDGVTPMDEFQYLAQFMWRRPEHVPHEIRRTGRSTSTNFISIRAGGAIEAQIYYGQEADGFGSQNDQVDNAYWFWCYAAGGYQPSIGQIGSWSHSEAGFKSGSGAFANPVIQTFEHCVALLNQNGVVLSMQDAKIVGGVYQSNKNDILVGGISDYFSLEGVRAESSGRLLYSVAGNALRQPLSVRNVTVYGDGAHLAGDGSIISWSQPGKMEIFGLNVTGVPSESYRGTVGRGSTASVINNDDSSWRADLFNDQGGPSKRSVLITSGVLKGQYRQISSNTASAIILVTAFGSAPEVGDEFVVTGYGPQFDPITLTVGANSFARSLALTGQVVLPEVHSGHAVYVVTSSVGAAGQMRRIKANSTDRLYLDMDAELFTLDWSTIPASGDTVVIDRSRYKHIALTSSETQHVRTDGCTFMGTPLDRLVRGADHETHEDYTQMRAGSAYQAEWPGRWESSASPQNGFGARGSGFLGLFGTKTLEPAIYRRYPRELFFDGDVAAKTFRHDGDAFGFARTPARGRHTLTATDGSNVLLRQLVDALAAYGIVVDQTPETTASTIRDLVAKLRGNHRVAGIYEGGTNIRKDGSNNITLIEDARITASGGRYFFPAPFNSADRIRVTNYTGLNGTNKATFVTIFTMSQRNGSGYHFHRWGATAGQSQVRLGISMGRPIFEIGDGTNSRTATGWKSLEPGRTYVMVWAYDGTQVTDASKVRCYVSEFDYQTGLLGQVAQQSVDFTGSAAAVPSTMVSPGSAEDALVGEGWRGYIDAVRVWKNRALTAEEAKHETFTASDGPHLRYEFAANANNTGSDTGFNGSVEGNATLCSDDYRFLPPLHSGVVSVSARVTHDPVNNVIVSDGTQYCNTEEHPFLTMAEGKTLIVVGKFTSTNHGVLASITNQALVNASGQKITGSQNACTVFGQSAGAPGTNRRVFIGAFDTRGQAPARRGEICDSPPVRELTSVGPDLPFQLNVFVDGDFGVNGEPRAAGEIKLIIVLRGFEESDRNAIRNDAKANRGAVMA